LTIAISVASGVDALFSLMPLGLQPYKLPIELVVTVLLIFMNLRGAKESIKTLLPIFLGFVFTHALLIVYGIASHASGLPALVPDTLRETQHLAHDTSWMFAAALFLKAYSLGGGTYTGIEAVSNNVQSLVEPRVRTGKLTMLYMAASLAFTAGGIICLYLLWHAVPVEGQTLNAVVFKQILTDTGLPSSVNAVALSATLAFEAGLLLVAANTGLLGGPSVLANMAVDSWVPHKFRYLSTRLVTQNGIMLMGAAALAILLWSRGQVDLLVVLYSINVFLTFSLSLAGLCIYWVRHRRDDRRWCYRLALSGVGLVVTLGILCVTVIAKFYEGGWITVLITSVVIGSCILIRNHYRNTKNKIKAVDQVFANQPYGHENQYAEPDAELPTAAFIVGSSRGGGLHAWLWVQRMFPNHFKNFVFINARTVDAHAYGGAESIELLRNDATVSLDYFVDFCHSHGLAAKSYLGFGTDAIDEVNKLCEEVRNDFPNAIFFTSKLISENENFLTRMLHNQATTALQRRLHLTGMQMVILPMKI
jgi:amino acid transporter